MIIYVTMKTLQMTYIDIRYFVPYNVKKYIFSRLVQKINFSLTENKEVCQRDKLKREALKHVKWRSRKFQKYLEGRACRRR